VDVLRKPANVEREHGADNLGNVGTLRQQAERM
jgi:hypothetical protein